MNNGSHQKLERKFGLLTAICMVVGTVIGSGIFFKAGKVLINNNGNMAKSLVTVALVGVIMVICSYVFSVFARKHEKVNGIVDYAEVALGPRYGYFVGWFMTTIYYPTLTACLAWVSAQYFCDLCGLGVASDLHMTVAAFFLIAGYVVNTLSPKVAGYFQVSTTFIKLVPIVFMAIVGTIIGLVNGTTQEAMTANIDFGSESTSGIFAAVVAFAFAYEGWIITTSINSELKDSKKNLPRALLIGAFIVIAVYISYFLGLTGSMSTEELINAGPREAFAALLGNKVFGTVAMVFVVISCLGTMNGLMLGCCRGMYSIAVRGNSRAARTFAQVDSETNMPTNSSIFGLFVCAFWLAQWEFGLIQGKLPAFIGWENDELPIISLYAMYIPIFISLIIKGKELNVFQRFVAPILGCLCCCFMVYCAISAYKIQALYYIIVFTFVSAVGMHFYKLRHIVPVPKEESKQSHRNLFLKK